MLISGIGTTPTYHLLCGFDARSLAVFKGSEGQFHIITYATELGHALIDRALYILEEWIADRDRCREAGRADTVQFRTKWELALEMLKRAKEAGVTFQWVVADTVYGQAVELRRWRCQSRPLPMV